MILQLFCCVHVILASTIASASSERRTNTDTGSVNKSLLPRPEAVAKHSVYYRMNYELAQKDGMYSEKIEKTQQHRNKMCQNVWSYISNGTCRCGDEIHDTIICNSDQVLLMSCHCMTYDKEDGLIVGYCPYGCNSKGDPYSESRSAYTSLPAGNVSNINNAMCGRLHRTGRLCGECSSDDFSPLVYSYDQYCIKCRREDLRHNWLKFVAAAFLPLTLFYFVVILYRVNASNPYLYGLIFLNQAIASPVNLRATFSVVKGRHALVIRLLTIPYTIWNLDFFRSLPLDICLNLTTLQSLALDYAIALYPLLLIVITYILIELHARGFRLVLWLWRPFHRCFVRFTKVMDIQSSIVKAFATFLLLSYVKILNSTIDMLLPVEGRNVRNEIVHTYVYYDASYRYLSRDHLPYAIMAIVFFFVLIFVPLILLLFYQTTYFQKCLHLCRLRTHSLHVFVDTFQGHFKDGTEPGTRDYRWFAAVYFLCRIITFYAIFGASKDVLCYVLTAIALICLAILMVILKPYKSNKVNIYHTSLVLFLAIICLSVTTFDESTMKAHQATNVVMTLILVLASAPTIALTVYIVYRVSRACYKAWKAVYQSYLQRKLMRQSQIVETGNVQEKKHLYTLVRNYQATST